MTNDTRVSIMDYNESFDPGINHPFWKSLPDLPEEVHYLFSVIGIVVFCLSAFGSALLSVAFHRWDLQLL